MKIGVFGVCSLVKIRIFNLLFFYHILGKYCFLVKIRDSDFLLSDQNLEFSDLWLTDWKSGLFIRMDMCFPRLMWCMLQ